MHPAKSGDSWCVHVTSELTRLRSDECSTLVASPLLSSLVDSQVSKSLQKLEVNGFTLKDSELALLTPEVCEASIPVSSLNSRHGRAFFLIQNFPNLREADARETKLLTALAKLPSFTSLDLSACEFALGEGQSIQISLYAREANTNCHSGQAELILTRFKTLRELHVGREWRYLSYIQGT